MKISNKKSRIFIDRRGNWFQDGIKITHRWTYLSNNANLDIDKDGNYFVDEGTGPIQVEVEDAPFIVKMIYKEGDSFSIKLNDETTEQLNFENLKINENNIPYISVKNNKFLARFSTSAYYELTKYADVEGENYFITNNGRKYYLNFPEKN